MSDDEGTDDRDEGPRRAIARAVEAQFSSSYDLAGDEEFDLAARRTSVRALQMDQETLRTKIRVGWTLIGFAGAAFVGAMCASWAFWSGYEDRVRAISLIFDDSPGVAMSGIMMPLLPAMLASVVGIVVLVAAARYFTNLGSQSMAEQESSSELLRQIGEGVRDFVAGLKPDSTD